MNGSKPEISTIGPYVYDEKMSKKIFAYGNGTIKYANYDIFSFNANQSCEKCTLQHKVWIPNIVFQVSFLLFFCRILFRSNNMC